ncbi:hypothetical protein NEF87_003914 [Candidatus Lokiarchaeum ossiferum]|uniref:Alpha/beta hydrolase n=1 Tax=Candidatus Lokiarchaeum ossiferum TaxID=2951803 RepID=A0ABY6HYJ8_9ARCH|nr:hypothetical protein NEF87_003914 [Candidatus Lokiarchaeum sp. B-35]
MISSENFNKNPSSDPIKEPISTDPYFFSMPKELKTSLDSMLESSQNKNAPNFWHKNICDELYVPVDDGEIRVFHYLPKDPISKRPLVFIPGWGVNPAGFQDLFSAIYEKVELYYIESREKKSSHIRFWESKFDMHQKAKDISATITYLDLNEKNYVLMGPCWGGAVIMQGLMDKVLTKAPTVITVDPMHRLWFSKFALKWITPFIPTFMFTLLKPIIKWFKLHNMHEPTQKSRAEAFIADAVMWKWKRAAQQVNEFELFGNLSAVDKEVFVINGTNDLIHDQRDYPKIAAELPKSRFLFLGTDESNRELLMGMVAEEFTKILQNDQIPPSLLPFEKAIQRGS